MRGRIGSRLALSRSGLLFSGLLIRGDVDGVGQALGHRVHRHLGVLTILLIPGGEVLTGRGGLHIAQGIHELRGKLIEGSNAALGNLEDIGALDDVIAELALHRGSGHVALVQAGHRIGVLGHEVVEHVPTHITALGSAAAVLRVLGRSVLEGDRASVNLVDQSLGAGLQSLVGLVALGGQQDVARALRTVELVACRLSLGEQGLIATAVLGIRHGLGQLRLHEAGAQVGLDVGFLGHAAGLEGLLEGLLALEHGLGLLHGLVNIGLLHGNVVLSRGLIVQILLHVVLDNLFAHRLGGVVVGHHPLAPGLVAFQAAIGAELGHIIGNGLLHDVLAIDGSGHSTAGTVAAAAHQAGAESERERNRPHALQSRALNKRGKFHPSTFRTLREPHVRAS